MNLSRMIAAVGIGILIAGGTVTAASADEGGIADQAPPRVVLANGHVLGPEDGVQVVTQSFESVPGEQVGATYPTTPEPGQVVPMDAWGSSYAYSEEILQTGYVGYGKAAANVYNGLRIVEVCFWWTRGGVSVSSQTCSDALFNGGWVPGPEKTHTVYDSLDPYAPPTIFNIKTVRIDPTAHW